MFHVNLLEPHYRCTRIFVLILRWLIVNWTTFRRGKTSMAGTKVRSECTERGDHLIPTGTRGRHPLTTVRESTGRIQVQTPRPGILVTVSFRQSATASTQSSQICLVSFNMEREVYGRWLFTHTRGVIHVYHVYLWGGPIDRTAVLINSNILEILFPCRNLMETRVKRFTTSVMHVYRYFHDDALIVRWQCH